MIGADKKKKKYDSSISFYPGINNIRGVHYILYHRNIKIIHNYQLALVESLTNKISCV